MKLIKKLPKSLYENSISQILRNSVSSVADLEKLAKKLDLDVKFNWIDDYNENFKLQILNIDADHIGGTHYIAVYNNEYYFDPLGLPIARDWLDYLEYTYIPIQDYNHGACGLYCILFLYYANKNDIDGFYSMFNNSNSII